MKEYKVLTQRDKFFLGKFSPEKLEEALNAYAKDGWKVIAITTSDRLGIGNKRQEIIVILEKDK